jgi:membrane-associated phospholipid phosphatase
MMLLSRRSLALASLSLASAPALMPWRARAGGTDQQDKPIVFYTRPRLTSPVFFWNEVSQGLVQLDHSIPSSQALAPGPCASSRALGAIHAVIADAAAYAYSAPFQAQFNTTNPGPIPQMPELFVGGAAWSYTNYIYNSTVFQELVLNQAKDDFLGTISGDDQDKQAIWNAGVDFGQAQAFQQLYDASLINQLIQSDPASYNPANPDTAHQVDPWNPDQGFYGQKYGTLQPLVLSASDVQSFAQDELSNEPTLTQDNIELLIAKGGRYPQDAGQYQARTQAEQDIGLFFAYDSAIGLGTPGVLFNKAIATIAEGDGLATSANTAAAARVFAVCNLAMADAAIVCWEAKWRLTFWRPVVAIQSLLGVKWQPYGAPRTNRDHDIPVLDAAEVMTAASPTGVDSPDPSYAQCAFTPNFPSYPSGHATFGGACFNALQSLRNGQNNVGLTLASGEFNGISTDNYNPLSVRPYRPMAFQRLVQPNIEQLTIPDWDTASLTGGIDASRIMLGVHWMFDQKDGDVAGRRVGSIAVAKAYSTT